MARVIFMVKNQNENKLAQQGGGSFEDATSFEVIK